MMSAIASAIQPAIQGIVSSAFTSVGVTLTPEQTIAAMFASGAKGVWYERAVASRLYRESIGVMPTTAAGGMVGLGLSKDQGLTKSIELASGPWLNGNATAYDTFASSGPSGFTASTAAAKSTIRVAVSCPTVAGKFYAIEFTPTFTAMQNLVLWFGDSYTRNETIVTFNGEQSAIKLPVFQASTNGRTHLVLVGDATAASTLSVTGFTARELPGNHQLQATVAARPLYQTSPQRLVFDSVDDVLNTTFAAALGASCTVGRAIPGTGAVITSGVNIGTSFADNVTAGALLIANRALTGGEAAAWTAYLNQHSAL